MIAKIWNYSGWINNTDPQQLKRDFGKLLQKAEFTVLGFTDHVFEPQGYTCIWILGESHFAIHTFPEDGCSYIELSSCNEQKLYDFLTMLPDYFDLLVNDADGGRYPAQKAGILVEDETSEESTEQETQESKEQAGKEETPDNKEQKILDDVGKEPIAETKRKSNRTKRK